MLILPNALDDERTFIGKVMPPLLTATLLGAIFLHRKMKMDSGLLRQAMEKEALKNKLRNKF